MNNSLDSDAAKVNALMHESALRGMMDIVGRDIQLKAFLASGASSCEQFSRGPASLVCKGKFGWGEATRKQAVLRDPETREPIHAESFRRHLDAEAHALYWALYGPPRNG